MKDWQYHPSPSLTRPLPEELSVFPREEDLTFSALRMIWNLFMRAFLKTYFRLNVSGKENLPREGNFVLVANHASHLDAVCLSAALPLKKLDKSFSVAAKDYFFSSFWRSFFSAVFINALPFDRHGKSRESLELCADVLRAAEGILIMFPEGTRSTTGQIQPFRTGVGLLTAGTDRRVLPCHIRGAFEAWPKGGRFPKPKKVIVRIGAPMTFENDERNQESYRRIAGAIEAAVRRLGLEEVPA